MAAKSLRKTECLNPNTGSSMKIDKEIYDLISKAIYHTLKAKNLSHLQKWLKELKIVLKNKKQNLKNL